MGHPYNQTQKIELQNLSAQRFVGTDIQKNILYGRDIPVLRYEYTFKNPQINHDYATYEYELVTSGTYFPTYLDAQNLNATGFYVFRGEPFDVPPLNVRHSGVEVGFPFDRPELGYITSGFHEPADRQVVTQKLTLTGHDIVYIDYDRPLQSATVPSRGDMLGIIQELPAKAGMVFETGTVFPGDYLPQGFKFSEGITDEYSSTNFFFYTGRVDGPSS
jgi:hypothetical protein